MGFTLESYEALKRGEKPPYCRFCATKTPDPDSSSYFPNSLRGRILGNPYLYVRISVRCRGVCKRLCSASFLEEFFSETGLLAFTILEPAFIRSTLASPYPLQTI